MTCISVFFYLSSENLHKNLVFYEDWGRTQWRAKSESEKQSCGTLNLWPWLVCLDIWAV